MDFSRFQRDWEQAQPEQNDFMDLPDGMYRVRINDVSSEMSVVNGQSSGIPRIIWTLEVLEGECAGCVTRKFDHIRSPRSFNFLKGDMKKLQIPIPGSAADIQFALNSAAGTSAEIQVKTVVSNGNPYKNIYFKKLIDKPAPKTSYGGGQYQNYQNFGQIDTQEAPF